MEASVISLPAVRRRRGGMSLSDQECFAVAAALCHSRNPWIPARDENMDGAVVMALLPYDAQDHPDYVIGRAVSGFFLEGHFCHQVFSSLPELLECLSRMTKN